MSYPLALDPKSIVVRRDTRQRQGNITEVDDLKQSITSIGTLINPIVIRMVGDEAVLIAGERRLRAYLELGLPEIPIRVFETLSEEEAEVIELEENIKRKELPWRDHVKAIGRLHAMLKAKTAGWLIKHTAQAISIDPAHLGRVLSVFEAIDSPKITQADSIDQAYNMLSRFAERKAESIVSDIIANGAVVFGTPLAPAAPPAPTPVREPLGDFAITAPISIFDEEPPPSGPDLPPSAETFAGPTTLAPVLEPTAKAIPSDPIICRNFLEWAPTYSGPKFSLIHCDFPYGNYRGDDSRGGLASAEGETFYDNHEEIYWNLLDGLTSNLDRLMSYSAHLIFWFNMNFYTETVMRLRKVGLMVHDHPLIWHKTPGGGGGLGVVPGTATTYPRRTYDTALLAVRGSRPLANPGMNSYAAPTVGNKIHPSQKPEPMLRHFLSMVVDETTTVFDPTCGSAAALRAAEDLGAKAILGIEMNPTYAEAALRRTLQARVLRAAGALNRAD